MGVTDPSRALLRHAVATVAYRGAKACRDAPPGFAEFRPAQFDAHLASDAPLGFSAEILLQGPVADSLTHIGQIAQLRRLAGSPIRGESYARAQITAGKIGPDQAKSVVEFDQERARVHLIRVTQTAFGA